MDPSQRQALSQALLGQGMAKQAGNTMQLYPEYQRQAIEAQAQGQEMPPFDVWVQQYQPQS